MAISIKIFGGNVNNRPGKKSEFLALPFAGPDHHESENANSQHGWILITPNQPMDGLRLLVFAASLEDL